MLCDKVVAIDHSGLTQINQHVRGSGHRGKSIDKFSNTQPKFTTVNGAFKLAKPINVQCLEAEALWAFKLA